MFGKKTKARITALEKQNRILQENLNEIYRLIMSQKDEILRSVKSENEKIRSEIENLREEREGAKHRDTDGIGAIIGEWLTGEESDRS